MSRLNDFNPMKVQINKYFVGCGENVEGSKKFSSTALKDSYSTIELERFGIRSNTSCLSLAGSIAHMSTMDTLTEQSTEIVDTQEGVHQKTWDHAAPHALCHAHTIMSISSECTPTSVLAASRKPDAQHAQHAHAPTTIMLRNFPRRCPQKRLIAQLDLSGFAHTYDFLYVPFCFNSNQNFGYGFINFRTAAHARHFATQWHGKTFPGWKTTSTPMIMCVAKIQGCHANLMRLMSDSKVWKVRNPDLHPAFFDKDGVMLSLTDIRDFEQKRRCGSPTCPDPRTTAQAGARTSTSSVRSARVSDGARNASCATDGKGDDYYENDIEQVQLES
eukprot:GEMP01046188.1.p1 GENE.GEMP01046188.1~~GEMP01046188.1.p1  ORF type:complete len:331 (+),score=74.46 GEMP01046188.1:66-1058(+)